MVTDIMKIIDGLNNNIEGINNSLKTILDKDGGVVIHDTFAPITTKVTALTTLGTTIVGALIGTMFTMWLFKRQEKMRIKQELRLEFYKGYKQLYKTFNDEILLLKQNLIIAKYLSDASESAFKLIPYNLDESTKWVKQCKYKYTLDKIIEVVKNANEYIEKINGYLEENKIILNKYGGELYNRVGLELFLIKTKICELEVYHKERDKIYNRRYTVDRLIAEYDEAVKYTIECEGEIVKIIEDVKRIHSNLECEFLNQYFK